MTDMNKLLQILPNIARWKNAEIVLENLLTEEPALREKWYWCFLQSLSSTREDKPNRLQIIKSTNLGNFCMLQAGLDKRRKDEGTHRRRTGYLQSLGKILSLLNVQTALPMV